MGDKIESRRRLPFTFFLFQTVPFNYARCYNEQCPKACNCLRRVAALLTTADTSYISTINPMCIPATGIDCPHFQNAEKIHVAWGISHLLDNVPYKDGTNSASTIQYAINSKRCKFPSSFALFT